MTKEFLGSLASLNEEQLAQAIANLSAAEKIELDRLLALPDPVHPEAPREWFHDAQTELWNLTGYKVIAFVAGAQSGKTVLAPWITLREIALKFVNGQPNEHLVASPTYKLMWKKLLPEYRRVMCDQLQLGEYLAGDICIVLSAEGIARLTGVVPSTGTSVTIWFGHAQSSESLESATYMSAVLDEAGQDSFRPGAFEAITRRVAIHEGRIYILTTPYNRNWFYEKIYKRGVLISYELTKNHGFNRVSDTNGNEENGIAIISCPSIMNPKFPLESWEFARKTMSDWEFDMFYMGKFSMPPGVVFNSFTDENIVPRFPIPPEWPVFAGIDFGLVNSACVLIAEEWKRGEPTGRYFVFGSYLSPEAREARRHVVEVHKMCPHKKPICYGGAHSESGWREAWSAAGLPIHEPTFSGLWIQINTLWTAFAQNKLFVFDDLQLVINELRSMSREIDDDEQVVPDRIKDESKYHRIACMRYIATRLFRGIYRKLLKGEGVPDHMSQAPGTFHRDRTEDVPVPNWGGLGADGYIAIANR